MNRFSACNLQQISSPTGDCTRSGVRQRLGSMCSRRQFDIGYRSLLRGTWKLASGLQDLGENHVMACISASRWPIYLGLIYGVGQCYQAGSKSQKPISRLVAYKHQIGRCEETTDSMPSMDTPWAALPSLYQAGKLMDGWCWFNNTALP
jgi:hypothetical protein